MMATMPEEEDHTAAMTATGITPEDSRAGGSSPHRYWATGGGRLSRASSMRDTPVEKWIICIRVRRKARKGRQEMMRKKAPWAAEESTRSRAQRF